MTTITLSENPNTKTLAVGSTTDGIKTSILYRHEIEDHRSAAGIPETSGAYILCEQQPQADGKWNVYVGKSSEGILANRFITHNDNPPAKIKGWTAAIILHGANASRLSQDEASALEWLLYEHLKDKTGLSLANAATPSDGHLPASAYRKLDKACARAEDIMHVLGINTNRQPSKTKPAKKSAHIAVSNIPRNKKEKTSERQPLQPGQILSRRYHNMDIKAVVLENGNIQITEIGDNKQPDNPPATSVSAAAQQITNNPTNGWDFWKTETGESLN